MQLGVNSQTGEWDGKDQLVQRLTCGPAFAVSLLGKSLPLL